MFYCGKLSKCCFGEYDYYVMIVYDRLDEELEYLDFNYYEGLLVKVGKVKWNLVKEL